MCSWPPRSAIPSRCARCPRTCSRAANPSCEARADGKVIRCRHHFLVPIESTTLFMHPEIKCKTKRGISARHLKRLAIGHRRFDARRVPWAEGAPTVLALRPSRPKLKGFMFTMDVSPARRKTSRGEEPPGVLETLGLARGLRQLPCTRPRGAACTCCPGCCCLPAALCCSASGLLLLCFCSAFFCSASALLLLCFCSASALLSSALLLLCFCSASALLLLCFCSASALLLLCFSVLQLLHLRPGLSHLDLELDLYCLHVARP